MKTISDLNEKWWYRLGKIFFVILGIFLLGNIVVISSFLYGPHQLEEVASLECDNGVVITLEDGLLVSDDHYLDTCTQLGDTEATSFDYYDGDPDIKWIRLVSFVLLGLVAVIIFLEGLRRIFYYVTLGKFFPPKR